MSTYRSPRSNCLLRVKTMLHNPTKILVISHSCELPDQGDHYNSLVLIILIIKCLISNYPTIMVIERLSMCFSHEFSVFCHRKWPDFDEQQGRNIYLSLSKFLSTTICCERRPLLLKKSCSLCTEQWKVLKNMENHVLGFYYEKYCVSHILLA